MIRRALRLQLVTGLSIALAVPTLVMAEQNAPGLATQTTLSVETHDMGGRTTATLSVTVGGEDRLPAAGAVAISDFGRSLAGAVLDEQGHATLVLDLPAGEHSFSAAYSGDATHLASASDAARVHAEASSAPDFQIAVAPTSLSLTAGQSGTVTASVIPENSSALSAPMFVTLSCSGLPDRAACVFTPGNVEILPNATAPITSSMVVLTQASKAPSAALRRADAVTLAILLPGALGLGGLAFSFRRRPWAQRLSLLALVAFVGLLGTTACNARYDYYNHGPPPNPATPSGTYNVNVTAQSSNGVTAITHSTTLVFTVK